MVAHRDGARERHHIAGRVHAGAVAQADKALRLVEGDEVLHAVAKAFRAQRGIGVEPFGAVGILPAAARLQGAGIVPVKQGDDRADADCQQRVDQRIVKRNALLVHRAHALRDQPRPGDREAIVLDAQLLHERDVLAEAMHMVAGHVAVVPLQNPARLVGKAIPDGRPLAALEGSALDLIGRGRRAPDEILSEAHGVPPVVSVHRDREGAGYPLLPRYALFYSLTPPSATPAMIYLLSAK